MIRLAAMSFRISRDVMALLLAALLPVLPAFADDGAAGEPAVESQKYEFPYKEIFGKSKHDVGNYAKVTHKLGASSMKGDRDDNYKAHRDLEIDIVASDAATLRLKARLVEESRTDGEASFKDDVLEEILGTGIFSSQAWEVATVQNGATGRLSTSFAPDVSWEFAAARYRKVQEPGSVIAVLRHDERRIEFLQDEQDLIKAYEEGDWLASGAAREYTFRASLDPELKLLLLGGMEAAKISARFWDSIH
jgi:hypothetical protein